MKLSSSLPLVLAGVSTALASRHGHDAIARRQAHIQRSLLDVCVGIDLDLELLDILPGGKPLIAGHLDVCLCLSVLPDFVKSDPTCQNAAQHIGNDGVTKMLQDKINKSTDKHSCQYPPHGKPFPTCDKSNPCNFQCEDGYTPKGDQCVCPAPKTECNGKCGYFPSGCGSSTPGHGGGGYGYGSSYGRRTAKRAPLCEAGKMLCGIPGGSKGKGYDCVDVQTNAESCGACTVDSPFSTSARAPAGKDCTAISNVADVLCQAGECVINKCQDGFDLTSAGDACTLVSDKRGLADVAAVVPAHVDVLDGALANVDALVKANAHVARHLADVAAVVPAHVGVLDRRGLVDVVADIPAHVDILDGALADVNANVKADAHVARHLADVAADIPAHVDVLDGALADVDAIVKANAHVARHLADVAALVPAHVDVLDGALANVDAIVKADAKVARGLVDVDAFVKADAEVGRHLADVAADIPAHVGVLDRRGLVDVDALVKADAKVGRHLADVAADIPAHIGVLDRRGLVDVDAIVKAGVDVL